MIARLTMILALLGVASAAEEVEFAAVMQADGQPRFVLSAPRDKDTSEWLTVGGSFHGYRIASYNAKRELLTVRKDQQSIELRLKGSHVGAPAPMVPSELQERGITNDDLVVRDSGPVRIRLSPGFDQARPERRFIDVNFDNGTDRCGMELGAEGPQVITRAVVPEAVRTWVSDDDIAAINAHLATVRGKWMASPGSSESP